MSGSPVVLLSGPLRRALLAWLRLPHAVRAVFPIAVMAALWWSSSRTPTPREPDALRALLHNGMHVVAYAVLAAGAWLAIAVMPLPSHRRWWMPTAWAVAVAYGAVDEIHQAFVPGRTSSFVDLVTDMCGAAFALFALAALLSDMAGAGRRAAVSLLLGCASAVLATFGPW